MRVEPKKSNKKQIVVAVVVIFLMVGLGFAYYLYATKPSNTPNKTKTQDTTSNSTKKQDQTDSITSSSSENSQATEEPTKVEGKTPTQYEGEDFDNEPDTDDERFRIPEDQ